MSDNQISNNQNKNAKKRAARERMMAERAAQERRSRRNKIIAITVAAVVVVGGGVGAAVGLAGGSGSGSGSSASSGKLVVPKNATGTDGTVIVYGRATAKNTLQMYEDFRCPVCDGLEKSAGTTIQSMADNGTYKIEYHMGTFLDNNNGGNGSMNALAAAGAALNESPTMFKKFHDVLYANQPEETVDKFGDTNYLLELAGKVPGLKTTAFVDEVKSGTFKPWAQKVSDAFNSSGVSATPTAILNGTKLNVGGTTTSAQWTSAVNQALGTKK
ncbi:thioredoxin domain-containing protein [Phaeacidiphilus oryzae]|uniref:thioredoxin domain-containing protein n=1 Tax=Phaeacidiphilus oryzae TaxID=348818 RepID=UPI000689293C|nr:thioredoxin domain-containing protein [Phaeacidiphilus oryzae]